MEQPHKVMHIVVGVLPPAIVGAIDAMIEQANGSDSGLLFTRQAVPADRMPVALEARRAAARAAADTLFPGTGDRVYAWYLYGYAINAADPRALVGTLPPDGVPSERQRAAFVFGLFEARDGREPSNQSRVDEQIEELCATRPIKEQS